MHAPVCPFCGMEKPGEPCEECARSHAGIEWTPDPRGWSPGRLAFECALVLLVATLWLLPIVHGIGAVLIFLGNWRTLDGGIARAFVGGVAVLTAAVEVSLLRGLMQRIAQRWVRRWSFRGGWVKMAGGKPLVGFGQIEGFRWFADYTQGQRTRG